MTDDQDPRLSRPSSKTGRLQRALLRLLAEHQAGGMLPTSGQFLWYELEQAGTVDKTKARGHPGVRRGIDQDANKALTHLRERGVIPWAWIVDETRSTYLYPGARSVLAGARDLLDQVRLDPWDGTPPPLLLVESRSLAGTLRDLAAAYCCDLAATNGQAGGFLHTEVAPLLAAVPGRPLGYLGDLDLAGAQIEANTRRVLEHYDPGLADPGRWQRLALTDRQADAYDLRRLAIVKQDRRYRDGHPHLAIETEALRQQVIIGIVRGWLDALLPEPLAEVLVREQQQRAAVVAALATLDGDGGRR
jgi:hypothetical protein